jgi:hypothetical protein
MSLRDKRDSRGPLEHFPSTGTLRQLSIVALQPIRPSSPISLPYVSSDHSLSMASIIPVHDIPSIIATSSSGPPASTVSSIENTPRSSTSVISDAIENRTSEGVRQLFCGGVAGTVAKTVTAPLSRLTILFQVHSLVTTRGHRPKFAMSLRQGIVKIIERGGIWALWRGNGTSVLHRFPYSAINFYVYETTLDLLALRSRTQDDISARTVSATTTSAIKSSSTVTQHRSNITDSALEHHRQSHNSNVIASHTTLQIPRPPEQNETHGQLVRRMSNMVHPFGIGYDENNNIDDDDDDDEHEERLNDTSRNAVSTPGSGMNSRNDTATHTIRNKTEDTPAIYKFIAGATAGCLACLACYPLDLVRTRLTTELEGQERYKGIVDCFRKIKQTEGIRGFFAGIGPTLLVAIPNFGISYTVYGTLKEHALDDELFYNLRRIDADSGEPKLGFGLTVACGAASGMLATLITFPMDTVRRRMQIQALHFQPSDRLSSQQQFRRLVQREGLASLYRGLTPELLKVVPMVGTMFVVYEFTKEILNVKHARRL